MTNLIDKKPLRMLNDTWVIFESVLWEQEPLDCSCDLVLTDFCFGWVNFMFSKRKLIVNQDSWFVSLSVHLLISCNFSVFEFNHYYNNLPKL